MRGAQYETRMSGSQAMPVVLIALQVMQDQQPGWASLGLLIGVQHPLSPPSGSSPKLLQNQESSTLRPASSIKSPMSLRL